MDELISLIYTAAAGTCPWEDALSATRDHLDLMGVQMVGFSTESGGVLFSYANSSAPAEAELAYLRTYHAVDPRIPLLTQSAPGHWMYDQDEFPEDLALTNPYYRDLLIPLGGRYSAFAKLHVQDGEAIMIGLLAKAGTLGFVGEARNDVHRIGFHLKAAAGIYQHTRRVKAHALVSSVLLARIKRPAFLLSIDRTVTFMNDPARALVVAPSLITLVRHRFSVSNSNGERAFATAFENVLSARDGRDRLIARINSRSMDAPVVASLTRLLPQQTLFAFGSVPQVLVMLHSRVLGQSNLPEPDPALWEAALELTPAQSRVALEIYMGSTLKRAARTLHVAESTVRTHLNAVYDKTGTTRQVQLVLALAALAN